MAEMKVQHYLFFSRQAVSLEFNACYSRIESLSLLSSTGWILAAIDKNREYFHARTLEYERGGS
jgi:hypothetical protein